MRPPYRLILLLVIMASLVFSPADAQEKFKLKPGARGKVCLNCHVTFEDILKNPYVHTPVKTGDCAGCHSPHTSSHGKLLAAEPDKICLKCHTTLIPENSVSSHKPAVEGECVKCHDPHGAKNKFNLRQAGNAVCFECHKEMGEHVARAKFKHVPVEKGCTTCHSPHASTASAKLLKNSVPSLCIGCHDTKKLIFQKQHMDYPVAEARCTACHNPHGSDKKSLIYNQVHSPFAKKMCNQCHQAPNSATPLKLQKTGFELCKTCHSNLVNEMFAKDHIHWPALDQTGCINCHSPHASDEQGLLKKPMAATCGQCHVDTIAKIKKAQSKHPPVQEGMCTTCHSPHSSDQPFLLAQPSIIGLCGSCHNWGEHSSHPVGEKTVDPRNKNLQVVCISCHNPHGTEYKKMLYYPTSTELCTNCHKQLKR